MSKVWAIFGYLFVCNKKGFILFSWTEKSHLKIQRKNPSWILLPKRVLSGLQQFERGLIFMLGKVWKADIVAACAVSSFPLSCLVSLLRKKIEVTC